GKLIKENIFKDIFIQPAAGDAGGALGAAQIGNYLYFDENREVSLNGDKMKGSYLGPDYSDKEALISFKKHKAVYHKIDSFDEICENISELLDEGNVVGWFQGRMEFGPRALGNRSILGDVRNKEMQKKLNLKIKYREGFRPFAPSVLIENSKDYFDLPVASPYMLLIADVNEQRRKVLPENYQNFDLWEKLYHER